MLLTSLFHTYIYSSGDLLKLTLHLNLDSLRLYTCTIFPFTHSFIHQQTFTTIKHMYQTFSLIMLVIHPSFSYVTNSTHSSFPSSIPPNVYLQFRVSHNTSTRFPFNLLTPSLLRPFLVPSVHLLCGSPLCHLSANSYTILLSSLVHNILISSVCF